VSDPRVQLQPVIIPIRPLTDGKDVSQPPQNISDKGASNLMNVRFHYGQLMMRNGFKVKYQGADEPPMSIIRAEDTDGSMIAMCLIGAENVWQTESSADVFQKMKLVKVGTISGICNVGNQYISHVTDADIDKIYPGCVVVEHVEDTLTGGQTVDYVIKGKDGADQGRVYLSAVPNATHGDEVTITIAEKVTLTADWTSDIVLWTRGTGVYQPWNINAKVEYPATGYADIIVWTNRVDGVFVMLPSSDGDPMACELLEDDDSVGLAGARAVAIFGGRLIVGGTTENPSQIVWSAPDQFNDFAPADGAGYALFGDDTTPIQNMVPLGDYLIIYKENSIWTMRKTGQITNPFMFEAVPSQGVGLSAPLSVTVVRDYHIFLGWDGVYKFSMNGLEPVALQVKDEILGRTGGRGIIPQYINRCFSTHVEAFNEYWLFIPAGLFPTAENLNKDGALNFAFIAGVYSKDSTQITSISDADFAKIDLGMSIADPLTGHIPTDTVVFRKTTVPNTIWMSKAATDNPGASGYVLFGSKQSWIFSWGTGPSDPTWAYPDSGNALISQMGGEGLRDTYQRIWLDNWGAWLSATFSAGALIGTGHTISVIVQMRTDTDATDVVLSCSSGGETDTYSLTIDASSEFQTYIWSFTTTSATYEDISFMLELFTAATLDVTTIQICDITNIDSNSRYVDPITGALAPGFKTYDEEIITVPLVLDTVNPWLCDTVWVYNYLYNSWSTFEMSATAFSYDALSTTKTIADLTGTIDQQIWRFDDKLLNALQETTLIGMADGQLYEISPAYSRDWETTQNVSISCFWESKDFDMGAPFMEKTYMRLALFHEVSHPATVVTIGISTDSGVSWYEQDITMRTGFTETFCDFISTGRQARFRLKATTPGFNITGLSIKVVPRGEAYAL
jgi:hypothetical protein